jgi:diguanylate cyclase (GGDEF)-like protein
MLEAMRDWLRWLLRPTADPRIRVDVARSNVRHIRLMAGFVIAVEALALTYVLFIANATPETRLTSIVSVLLIIAICVGAIMIANHLLEKSEEVSPLAAGVFLMALFAAASAWGMAVSFRHYVQGGQIITFYIVQLCFVCFMLFRPTLALLMFGGSYGIFYLLLYLFDGAPTLHNANYALFALIAIVGSAIRYQSETDEFRQQHKISELNKVLYRTSTHDELTDLLNRQALRDQFDSFLNTGLHVVILDIDHFKEYNDVFGHPVGDKVIAAVAQATKDAFASGRTFRYGGDEFLVIIPNADEADVQGMISNWHSSIADIHVDGIERQITCSYGMARGTPATAADLRGMIVEADARLYDAKATQHAQASQA